ncbi:MAG: hypothetical protein NC548_24810 [Lachnospiraceae bacterium]|nr:hypothetical protein [Lachnospiraceae bacterium]
MCKYVLVGKSASGRGRFQKIMVEHGFKPLKQYTTKSHKQNEHDDNYHFISQKKMNSMIQKNKFASVRTFKNSDYAFTIEDLKNCDVAILSIGNIEDLRNWYPNVLRSTSIIFLDIPIEIRKKRLSTRYNVEKEHDVVINKINEDEHDFRNFNYFDIKFTSTDEVLKFINKITLSKNYD